MKPASRLWHLIGWLTLVSFPLTASAVSIGDLSVHIISGTDLIEVLGRLVNVVLLWAGILAFFYALYGGFLYLTAGGDSSKASAARQTIYNALIGVIIIALSLVVVRYVVGLTKGNFSNTGASNSTSTNSSQSNNSTGTQRTGTSNGSSSGTTGSSGTSSGTGSTATGPDLDNTATAQTGSLSGAVRLPAGNTGTLSNILVTIEQAQDTDIAPNTTNTDDNGRYFFTNLAPGSYSVVVNDPARKFCGSTLTTVAANSNKILPPLQLSDC